MATRSIHNDVSKAKIDYKCIKDFKQDDYIILVSDGVTDVLSNYELLEVLNSKKDISGILSELDVRLLKTAKDNFSLILITE